ncbi:MAG TPA: helix-turn-helix transcriptional regulator [Polyangiaceae bacterium]|nr:helix-turn-helix transcriptional regulator [Polyangiaceae bacterium]
MSAPTVSRTPRSSVGPLLQFWRRSRNLSQLALATQAGVSSRHLSFVETGRANPSREMVLLLANTLDVPLRERNALLLAAGFAPFYLESSLDAPGLSAARGALDAILRQQEPFPAVVMNRHWDILRTNEAATRFFSWLLGDRRARGPANVVRLMFHPDGLRPFVANWPAVAEALLRRVHREAVGGVPDQATKALLAEILDYPDVSQTLRSTDFSAPLLPIVPVSFRKNERAFDFFSTVTTLGTPQDVTLQEIRIECFFPVNGETERAARELAMLT